MLSNQSSHEKVVNQNKKKFEKLSKELRISQWRKMGIGGVLYKGKHLLNFGY